MSKLSFCRILLCAAVLASPFVASAEFTIGSDDPAPGFNPINYSYGSAYLSQFTYTYTDESNQSVTVPITTPATTKNAMIALLREVYTNTNIPGRKWIHRRPGDLADSPNCNTYVSYSMSGTSWESTLYNIPAGNYEPAIEGETCLLVEGIDGSFTNDDDDDSDDGFQNIKCITLVTNRYALADNSTIAGLESPGYVFNIAKPLRKYFFITKGKARGTHSYPFGQLFEEYSPNEQTLGEDQTQTNIYNALLQGTPYYVRHDCSTVIKNAGHIMVMGSLSDPAPADINLSVFIPFYRSYNDVSKSERYTWYSDDHRPFFFYNSIYLTAVATPDKTNLDENGSPTHAVVNLRWSTNFRSKLFNTSDNLEFQAFKVANGVVDSDNPIVFSGTPQEPRQLTQVADPVNVGSYITLPNPYLQQTTISGTKVLSNFDDESTGAFYYEPIEENGRYVTYVIRGRHVSDSGDPTQSNLARVYIPGRNELGTPGFIISLDGNGTSEFDAAKLTNDYINPITFTNRDESLAIKGDDIEIGGVFTLYRTSSQGGAPQAVATITVDRRSQGWINTSEDDDKHQYSWFYFSSTLQFTDPARTSETDTHLTWKCIGTRPYGSADDQPFEFGPLMWHEALDDDGNPYSSMGITDQSSVLAYINDVFSVGTGLNSHPDNYSYYIEYTDTRSYSPKSNNADVDIYKSRAIVRPETLTFDDMMGLEDGSGAEVQDPVYYLTLSVLPTPLVQYYRVRFQQDDQEVVALVQNYNNRLTVSLPDEDGVFRTLDDFINVPSEPTDIEIPLSSLKSDYYQRIASMENLVVDVLTDKRGVSSANYVMAAPAASLYNTYGGPTTKAPRQPELIISSAKIGDYTDPGNSQCTMMTNIYSSVNTTDCAPAGYDLLGVSHYVVWRDTINPGEAGYTTAIGFNDYPLAADGYDNQTEGFRKENDGIFKGLYYQNDDHSSMYFGEGLCADADDNFKVAYTVRAYVVIAPQSSGASKVSAKSVSPLRYIPAENSITITYNHYSTVTGIENVGADTAPVEYYNLQGVRIDNPTPGVYIRRQGNTASKILIK